MILSYSRILLSIAVLLPSLIFAQDNPSFTWEWEGDINTSLGENLFLNMGAAYRNQLVDEIDETPLTPDTRHFQLSSNISHNVGFYGKLAAGIMYRFNSIGEPGAVNELRTTQQYSYSRRYNALRFVHRFTADQRIRDERPTIHRFRYRFSFDLPLNGMKLDRGEFYLVVSAETLLNAAKNSESQWDERLVVAVGNQFLDDLKVQLDLEYRMEAFNINTVKRLFLVSSLVYKL